MAPIRLPIAIEAVEIVSALISRQSGIDTDEDGLYDSVETDISAYSETITDMLGTPVLNLNPDEEESIPGRKDASIVRGFLSELETKVINLGILTDGYDKFMDEAVVGLAFL